jgi:hypothetical protein
MAEWTDIVIPKPKEPYKQNLPFKQIYNEYGFNHNDSMYSLVEENRDFRKYIENEIRMEEVKTQNVLGNHITGEINRNIANTNVRAAEIKQKIDSHHDYVVNTIKPKIDDTNTKVTSNTSLLIDIWNKIQGITHWI